MAILSFKQATGRHRMLAQAVGTLHQAYQGDDPADQQWADNALSDAWGAALGLGGLSDVARAVRVTIPIDFIPLMRVADGIPAAYFVSRLGDVLAKERGAFSRTDGFAVRGMIRTAFDMFEERRKAADTVSEGFGFDRSDAWKTMRQIEDKSKYMEAEMLQIAKLAGRMFKAFQHVACPHPSDDPQQVTGLEVGGDIDRVLEEEIAAMPLDPEALMRVADEKANQHELKGETPRGRGPLVIALDESGSMHAHRMTWSKACAVALTRVARQELRTVRIVHFSTATQVHDVTDDPGTWLELARSHLGGGTDIGKALSVSVHEVGELDQLGKRGADVVVVTDGQGAMSDTPFKEMKDKGIKLWTVAIDVELRGSGSYGSKLVTNAAKYIHIDSNTIARQPDDSVNVAVEIYEAALDNSRRSDDDAN